jgi:hypothetical protein
MLDPGGREVAKIEDYKKEKRKEIGRGVER